MKRQNAKLHKLIMMALFTAILVVMSITPLGYVPITPALTPTLLMIPVAIGAVLLGQNAGAFLGLVFGLTSFAQCFGASPFGVAIFGINPIFAFIVCVIPRIAEGYLAGLVYHALQNINKPLGATLAGLTCAGSNTVLFMGLLMLLYGNTDYILNMQGSMPVILFIITFVGIQGALEAAITTAITPLVSIPVSKAMERKNR